MDITKEELVQLIKDTILEIKAEKEAEKVEEKTEDVKETTESENACVKNEDTVEEEVKEPTPEPIPEIPETPKEEKKEESKEEVIKIEALNSAPTIVASEPEWKKMKQKEFIEFINSGNYKKLCN